MLWNDKNDVQERLFQQWVRLKEGRRVKKHKDVYIEIISHLSIKAPVCQWVSESVCLFVP